MTDPAEKRSRDFYASRYGERRKKRHRKGQVRMYILLALLALLLLVWLLLPGPGDGGQSADPAERTRDFPAAETGMADPAAPAGSISSIPPEDAAPNPLLEGYIGQELRQGPYRMEITYPTQEARLIEQADGTHLFRLAGQLYASDKSDEEEVSAPFRVHLFSNKPADYEGFDPIFTEDLSFQVEGDHFVFQLSHPEVLTPGLYYYLIEEKDSGELYAVGKVTVAP